MDTIEYATFRYDTVEVENGLYSEEFTIVWEFKDQILPEFQCLIK